MDEDSSNEDNIPLSQWLKARNLYHCDNCTDLGDYVDVDNNVATLGILTESEILIYLISVSYTHLDVYKRQTMDRCAIEYV